MREFPDLPMNSYICALLYNGICRVSVPVFFMISGALILDQPTDYNKNIKRTFSMFLKTVMWITVFFIWDLLYLGDLYDLNMVFTTPIRVHFWFLYVLFGIYITVPLWQKLVSGESKKLMLYFTVLFIALLMWKFIADMQGIRITYEIPLVENCVYVGYFIAGYVIRHYADDIKIKKWHCILVFLICGCATTLLTLFFSIKENQHVETFNEFRTVFIGLASMAVFLFVMKTKEPKPRRWISFISKHSFNVYMIHVFFLDILQQNIDVSRFSAWIGFPAFFISMFLLSIGFSFLIGKITKEKI